MMRNENLDESVREFKEFINNHPQIIKEIRVSGRSWQEYYEKWALLGEDDPYWHQFKQESRTNNQSNDEKSTESYNELFNQFISMMEKVDLNNVQKQVGELNTTVSTVQQLLNQYLENRQKDSGNDQHPFYWFRD